GGLLLLLLVAALKDASLQVQQEAAIADQRIGSIKVLGFILYSKYQMPFEVASILFLVAMTGAVVLGKKDASDRSIGLEAIK
ncbi:MAG: NADH-quinone oxidoreductase subunit J, partial [Chitinophagales bacterium]